MTEALPCLILPLQQQNLLVPNAAIAEIVTYHPPKPIEDMPDWLIGILTWRGIHIPLAYIEKMESYFVWTTKTQIKEEEDVDKAYIAIINRMYKIEAQNENIHHYPFFSIILKNSPKLYHITEDSIEMIRQFETDNPRFLMEVKVQNNNALIPNLVSLWRIIDTLPSRLQWFRPIIL